jgi:hypothetical protein
MKKVTIILTMFSLLGAGLSYDAAAQHDKDVTAQITSTAGVAKTSISGTDTAYVIVKNNSFYEAASFELKVLRTASTVALKAVLQVSNDPDQVGWHDLNTDTLSLSFSSGYKSYSWSVAPTRHRWYRMYVWSTGGTATLTGKGYLGRP